MAELRIPGDAVPPIQARLVDNAAVLSGARVAKAFPDPNGPDPWHVDTAAEPLIVVSDDSGPTMWPVWSEPLIRVTVYAKGLQTAKELRRRAVGVLLGEPIPNLHIDRNRIGYLDTFDPNSGADMASLTVTATVRTEVITV